MSKGNAAIAVFGILAVLVLGVVAINAWVKVKPVSAPPQVIVQPGQPPLPSERLACDPLITPRLTIYATDELAGTSFSENHNVYRKVGDSTWSGWEPNDEIDKDLVCGAEYEFLVGVNSTSIGESFLGQANGPYFRLSIPNTEAPSHSIKAIAPSDAANLSYRFRNSVGTATSQAIGSGGTERVSLGFRAADNQEAGNRYLGSTASLAGLSSCLQGQRLTHPNIFCVYLNDTEFQSIDAPSINGEALQAVSTPTDKTDYKFNLSRPDAFTQCWDAPIFSEDFTDIYFTLKAETGVNPANHTECDIGARCTSARMNDTNSNLAVLWQGDFYIDEETQQVKCGVVDDDNNATAFRPMAVTSISIT